MISSTFPTAVLILLLVLVTTLYFYLVKINNYWRDRGVPFEKPVLLFGNFLDIAFGSVSPAEYLSNLYNKFDGPYFGMFAINQPILVVKEPQIIKRILIQDFKSFPNRYFYADEKIDPIFGNTLLVIKNPLWRTLRSKLSPFFSPGKLKMMFPLIKECGDIMDAYLQRHVEKSLDFKEVSAKFTTNMIATCAYGIDANCFVADNSDFRVAGRKIFDNASFSCFKRICYIFAHTIVTMFRFRFIHEPSANFLGKTLWETIRERQARKISRNDLIDILIKLKNEDSSDDDYKLCKLRSICN